VVKNKINPDCQITFYKNGELIRLFHVTMFKCFLDERKGSFEVELSYALFSELMAASDHLWDMDICYSVRETSQTMTATLRSIGFDVISHPQRDGTWKCFVEFF
jgi:hypothetical protein